LQNAVRNATGGQVTGVVWGDSSNGNRRIDVAIEFPPTSSLATPPRVNPGLPAALAACGWPPAGKIEPPEVVTGIPRSNGLAGQADDLFKKAEPPGADFFGVPYSSPPAMPRLTEADVDAMLTDLTDPRD